MTTIDRFYRHLATGLALAFVPFLMAGMMSFILPAGGEGAGLAEASNALSPAGESGYAIGDLVEDFSLKNVDGEMVSLTDFPDAKGFILIFTCNTCPYAVAYEQRIIELDAEFAAKGYPVVAINPNDAVRKPGDSYDAMVSRAQEKGYSFPYLHDATQDIARQFGATRTPHVYLLQKNNAGRARVAFIGAIDDAPYEPEQVEEQWLRDAIAALDAERKPDPARVKAIGCTIKWAQ